MGWCSVPHRGRGEELGALCAPRRPGRGMEGGVLRPTGSREVDGGGWGSGGPPWTPLCPTGVWGSDKGTLVPHRDLSGPIRVHGVTPWGRVPPDVGQPPPADPGWPRLPQGPTAFQPVLPQAGL